MCIFLFLQDEGESDCKPGGIAIIEMRSVGAMEIRQAGIVVGADIHIWDAFGMHSEVTLDLSRGHLSAIKIDAKTVAKLQEAVGGNDTLCGHNPLHYLPEEEED